MAPKFFADENGNALSKKPKAFVKTTSVKRSPIPIDYFTIDELIAAGGRGYKMIWDIECFKNYFLIGFKCKELKKYWTFEVSPVGTMDLNLLNWVIFNFQLIGFNSKKYDELMLLLSLRGYSAERLKEYSNKIIAQKDIHKGLTVFEACEEFGLRLPNIDHIDLIEVCPLQGSLKKYAARLMSKRIQDLPFDHNKELTLEEAEEVKNYCLGSDIPATELILDELSEQMNLRYNLTEKYGVDLRSKSDAQIAEAVITKEIERITGKKVKKANIPPGTSFKYIPPPFIEFQTDYLKSVYEDIKRAEFITSESGAPLWPAGLGELVQDDINDPDNGKGIWSLKVNIANKLYKMGMGGLHSCEKTIAHYADEETDIDDDDVESYYPRIILILKLFPKHLTEAFLTVYAAIVEQRVTAKRNSAKCKKNGDKDGALMWKVISDSLKIVINGSFGKLGSIWSAIYAPDLMIQVTLSGQLLLLMLIEMFELNNIPVISANTDGIVTKYNKKLKGLKADIIKSWENHTGFKTENTNYLAVYSKDVNNYIAIKTPDKNGIVKAKAIGAYKNPWDDPELAIFRFHKNPVTTVCIEAVKDFLISKKPIEESIRECTNINRFIVVKSVAGGAHKDGVYLGKEARWYYAQDVRGQINYVTNGNKVGDSDGAKPIMDMPDEFPSDLDYNFYIEKANKMLYDIAYYKKPETVSLFDD